MLIKCLAVPLTIRLMVKTPKSSIIFLKKLDELRYVVFFLSWDFLNERDFPTNPKEADTKTFFLLEYLGFSKSPGKNLPRLKFKLK